MLTTPNTPDDDQVGILTRQSIIAVLAGEIFIPSPVVLYPAKFAVELLDREQKYDRHLQ